ncbi:MAG TPA: hypothetical protein VN802_14670 [Stellaceae bacterium]|nr:hypothetical protein [Stellaceae bacterium]
MPRRLRLIGRYGNGALALLNALFAPVSIAQGQPIVGLGFLAVLALACFNIYLVEKAAWATSEEEWLAGEVRKAELRHKLELLNEAETAAHEIPKT